MSGGGAAPAMKMSDVFLLLGVTFLVGGLFVHGLVSPTSLHADAEPTNLCFCSAFLVFFIMYIIVHVALYYDVRQSK